MLPVRHKPVMTKMTTSSVFSAEVTASNDFNVCQNSELVYKGVLSKMQKKHTVTAVTLVHGTFS
jgi:hypothetical protein